MDNVWGNLALRDKVNALLSKNKAFNKSGASKLSLVLSDIGLSYSEFTVDRDTQHILGAISHGSKKIFINADLSDKDKHMTLAHEIGHAVLHPNEDMIDFRRTTQEDLCDFELRKEREANVFSYELVMPYPHFIHMYDKFEGDIQKLSDYFLVPKKYVSKRIEFLTKQVEQEYIYPFKVFE